MSQNTVEEKKQLSLTLVEAIQTNFNSILSNADIKLENDIEFDTVSEILDNFIKNFCVIKDKKKSK